MSAYSDWRHGYTTEEEYNAACRREEAMDRAREDARDREEESEGVGKF